MDIDYLLALVMSSINIYILVILNYNLIKIKSVCFNDIDYTNVFICQLESEGETILCFY